MPRFERDPPGSGPLIQGFSGRSLRVDGELYEGVQLTPRLARAWRPPPLEALTLADFELILGLDPAPEFVILGTGTATVFPARSLVLELEDRGVGLEAMDSRAAARTWAMLRGEERWIAAAIMPL